MTEHTPTESTKVYPMLVLYANDQNDQEQSGLRAQLLVVQCGSCYVIKDNNTEVLPRI